VVAEGATHKTKKLSKFGGDASLDEFVRENQHVTLKYWENDGTRYIEKLRAH